MDKGLIGCGFIVGALYLPCESSKFYEPNVITYLKAFVMIFHHLNFQFVSLVILIQEQVVLMTFLITMICQYKGMFWMRHNKTIKLNIF